MLIALPFFTIAQSVSIFAGASTNNNLVYGAEFKSETLGLFVERYQCDKDYPKYVLPINQQKPQMYSNQNYDGIIFGINRHFKALSNVLLSCGIGLLNEYTIYHGDRRTATSMTVGQKFSMELSAGKDFNVCNHFCIGVKGGVNNCTSIFGILSLGVKLN